MLLGIRNGNVISVCYLKKNDTKTSKIKKIKKKKKTKPNQRTVGKGAVENTLKTSRQITD